jgi:nucleotide-binding universal stress UspA family protein
MHANDQTQADASRVVDQGVDMLSPVEARLAEEEAFQRAGRTTGEAMASRRPRVEAEAKRISDEVTREAQRRQRTAPDLDAEVAPSAADTARSEHGLPSPPAVTQMLVPLDGTSCAERALPYAAAVASATGAAITLAHIRASAAARPIEWLTGLAARRAGARPTVDISDFPTYMHWLREWLKPSALEADIALVDAPSVVEGLLRLAEEHQVGIIVLATHARRGPQRYLLGNVADALVQYGRMPLLVVPPHAAVPDQALPALARLLVPLDGSELAEQALASVLSLLGATPQATGTRRELVLLCVADTQATLSHSQRYLADVRERLASLPPLAATTVDTAAIMGSAPETIVVSADQGVISMGSRQQPFDLLVMATHGRGGLGRLLFGSVAGYVLPRVHLPVLLIPPLRADT